MKSSRKLTLQLTRPSLTRREANLANAKANLELQQVQVARDAQLYTNKLLDASDYDTAVATRDEAAAQVQIQEASVTNATANLGYCKIRSPVDGMVISRSVEVGQTVASSFSTPTLFQIANDLTKMQIDSNVAEADIGGIEEGQDVSIQRGRVSVSHVSRQGHASAQFADHRQQRRYLRLRHRRENRRLQIETGHDRQSAEHHHRATAKCFENPERGVALSPGGNHCDVGNKQGVGANRAKFRRRREAVWRIWWRRFGWIWRWRGRPAARRVWRWSWWPAARRVWRTRRRASRPHGLLLSGEGKDATLKPVQIKTGITDGAFTEVLSGLDEGDIVVTGLAYGGAASASAPSANPFGGPRFR